MIDIDVQKAAALWNSEVLRDAFSDLLAVDGSVTFDNQVLTIRTPEFHIVLHRDLTKSQITMISDSEVFDGAAVDMISFFRGIDVVAAKILSEIDGVDRGV
jgi:hypothetical protein